MDIHTDASAAADVAAYLAGGAAATFRRGYAHSLAADTGRDDATIRQLYAIFTREMCDKLADSEWIEGRRAGLAVILADRQFSRGEGVA